MIIATLKQQHCNVLDSVDHDLRLKADHSPRLDRWTARLSVRPSVSTELDEVSRRGLAKVCGPPLLRYRQREQFVIYCDYLLP